VRPGSQSRLGGDAARSRWTTPQRREFAVDAGELWRVAVTCIGSENAVRYSSSDEVRCDDLTGAG
jgi:hypothetical protein